MTMTILARTRAATGKHRWDKGGQLDAQGRRIITTPAPAGWWPPAVPAERTTATAVLDTDAVRAASTQASPEPTSTGTRDEVIAAMLADLADGPAAAVTDIFTADTTSDTPKDPA